MPDLNHDMVIVGMGPVGLATAYHAAKNGHKVLILEKRSEAESMLRTQFVVIDPAIKQSLMGMIGLNEKLDEQDIKFLNTLAHSAEIKISVIQRFIKKRINHLNSNNLYSAGRVEMLNQSTIDDVNLNKGEAVLQTPEGSEEIRFTHLVGADGAGSSTLEKVNKNLQEEEKIKQQTPKGLEHIERTYHLGALVKISRADHTALNLPKREFVSSFLKNKRLNKFFKSHQLYFLRFDKKSYEANDGKMVKCGFVGEVPKEVYDQYQQLIKEAATCKTEMGELEKQLHENHTPLDTDPGWLAKKQEYKTKLEASQQFALSYIKKAAAKYLKVKEDELTVEVTNSKKTPAKDRLKILTFQGSSKKSDKAVIAANNHTFYLAGDSNYSPQYALGHGLNDGLEAAEFLGKIPRKNQFANNDYDLSTHMEKYNALSNANVNTMRTGMRLIRWFRKFSFIREKVAKILEWVVDKRETVKKVVLKNSLSHTINDKGKDSIERYIDDLAEKGNVKGFETLLKNSTIVKQYGVHIMESLNKMGREVIPFLELNEKNKDATSLFYVVKLQFEKKINGYHQELIKMAEKNPNKKDHAGKTPLYYAVQYGDLKTIQEILALGANPNKMGYPIFSQRVLTNAEIGRELLKHGANPFAERLTGDVRATGDSMKFSEFALLFLQPPHNSKFAIECLRVMKDPHSPLYKTAHKQISTKVIDLILNAVVKTNLISSKISTDEAISLLKQIPEYAHLPSNTLDGDEAKSLLKQYVTDSLESIKQTKQHSFKFNFSGILSLFKKPKNDPQFAQSDEFQQNHHKKTKSK